jgi:hypothetical protein
MRNVRRFRGYSTNNPWHSRIPGPSFKKIQRKAKKAVENLVTSKIQITQDVSKQIVSACIAHFLNLSLAILLSLDNNTDQCVWYFINILMDCTLGVFICYLFMIFIDWWARSRAWKVKFRSYI